MLVLGDLPFRMHSLGWSYNNLDVLFFISHFSMKPVYFLPNVSNLKQPCFLHDFIIVHDLECSWSKHVHLFWFKWLFAEDGIWFKGHHPQSQACGSTWMLMHAPGSKRCWNSCCRASIVVQHCAHVSLARGLSNVCLGSVGEGKNKTE